MNSKDSDNVKLQEFQEEEEIFQVVREMDGDKSLGPDGFSMAYYHHCWRVVEKDVLAVFEESYQYCKFEKFSQCYFHCLNSKKE